MRHGKLTFSGYHLEDWAALKNKWERLVQFDPYENDWEW